MRFLDHKKVATVTENFPKGGFTLAFSVSTIISFVLMMLILPDDIEKLKAQYSKV